MCSTGGEEGRIEAEVRAVLADLTGSDAPSISLDARLVKDLHIGSDDLTFVFVPVLEKRLRVAVPTHEWRTVLTGRDAARLLERHLRA
jgi:hypothetical protein